MDDTIFSGKDEKAFETCDKTKAFTKSGEEEVLSSVVYEDNGAYLRFAKLSPQTKHIGLHYHLFRIELFSLEIDIQAIASEEQISLPRTVSAEEKVRYALLSLRNTFLQLRWIVKITNTFLNWKFNFVRDERTVVYAQENLLAKHQRFGIFISTITQSIQSLTEFTHKFSHASYLCYILLCGSRPEMIWNSSNKRDFIRLLVWLIRFYCS